LVAKQTCKDLIDGMFFIVHGYNSLTSIMLCRDEASRLAQITARLLILLIRIQGVVIKLRELLRKRG
jgi:hypothetical protein